MIRECDKGLGIGSTRFFSDPDTWTRMAARFANIIHDWILSGL
jgi:hypothetical protein